MILVNGFQKIHNIQLSDFRERTRSYSFLILLGFVVFCSFFIIPPNKDSGKAFYLLINDTYKPLYNSAFIGTAASFLSILLLSLFGFYAVNNSIERDRKTRVGEIIASTPISKTAYLFGKLISNFAVLSVISAVDALVIIIIYFIRGQAPINFLKLLAPFFILVLPALLLISSAAVLFETISFFKGTFGNVVYFFIWSAVISVDFSLPENINTFDILGFRIISKNLKNLFPVSGDTVGFSWSYRSMSAVKPVVWEGIDWNSNIIFQRLIVIIVALIITLISVLFFNRFDTCKQKHKKFKKDNVGISPILVPKNKTIPDVNVCDLTTVSPKFKFLNLINAEIKLMIKGLNWWWILIEFAFNILCIFSPIEIVQDYIFPITWLLPIAIWSSMGCREKRYSTNQLIFSAENSANHQIPAVLFAGLFMSFITGSGMLVRLIITGNLQALLPFAAGALFIPSFALCLGVLADTNKLFEVIYIVVWCLGPINHIFILNFTEVLNYSSYIKSILYIIVSLVFLLSSILIRQIKIDNE